MQTFIRRGVYLVVVTVLLTACASKDVQVLQQEKADLQTRLDKANSEINRLKQVESTLRDKIGDLEHTTSVLATEKSSRVEESSSLRNQVRKFVQNNVDALKQFMVQGNLLDYVGSELVPRAKRDKKPVFLVDFANTMPSTGILTGVGGHFTQSGSFVVKVLHPVDSQYVVTWESKSVEVQRPGKLQVQFPVSVGVEKGDVIGYYFAGEPNVSYDTSTGDTLYQDTEVALGGMVSRSTMLGASDRRAYSLGVYGLLDGN